MMRKVFFFLILAALSFTGAVARGEADSRLTTIPRDPALERTLHDAQIEQLIVMSDGTAEPLLGAARARIDELTGRSSIPGQSPEFTYLSLIFRPELWWNARILPVEHPRIAKILNANDKWISPKSVTENPNIHDLETAARDSFAMKQELEAQTKRLNAVEQVMRLPDREMALSELATGPLTRESLLALADNPAARREALETRAKLHAKYDLEKPFAEAVERLLHRVTMIGTMNEQFYIMPDSESVRGDWLSPAEAANRESLPLFKSGIALNDALNAAFHGTDAGKVATALSTFQGQLLSNPLYPAASQRHLLRMYESLNPFRWAAWIYLLGAIMFALYFFFEGPGMRLSALGVFLAGYALHTGAVGLRLVLTGHMPVSNMYESITFMSWAAMTIALIFELVRRNGAIGLGASVLGFLALTASSLMPLEDTRFHPLRAVLNSYWLNIHVTTMLLSYAAFSLSALFAGTYMLKSLLGREALFGGKPVLTLAQTEEFAYRLVQVGWPLITLGVTLGAIWANTAWGRYWGWDPKETWAFITWIIYTIYLHTRIVIGWRGRMSALACLIGFLSVIITWLGVSFHPWFAGGLHTYASPT